VELSPEQLDRAAGVLLGTAAGDALGAGYEFGPPLPTGTPVAMCGGGPFGWAPGEWTDDTSMAIVIARVAADGHDLRGEAAQDRLVVAWADWARNAPDVGNQTREVLAASGNTAAGARSASTALHERTGRSAGNGSLMRTAPLALAFLHDEAALVEAATAVSGLTHHDPQAGEACVLWCLAIRHAILNCELEVHVGLDRLPADRATAWEQLILQAEDHDPAHWTDSNGWVVSAFQTAWSAITRTPSPGEDPTRGSFAAQHLQFAIEAAVRCGDDTDTVAAIAGGLLGARWGAATVPAAWRKVLHGWPGLRAADLTALGSAIATGKTPRTSM
jgi:ADP-ribosylglycohydrolase